jgi:flagellar basal-body rod protein FlgC
MSFDHMLGSLSISGTGMKAERLRMEVLANNIANANSTRTPEGGPFRRKEVVFEAVLRNAQHRSFDQVGAKHMGGVNVLGIVEDDAEMPRVHNPGHPDADADGFVTMPNVNLPIEMVNLVTATRAYEANLKAAQSMQQMADQSFSLLQAR